jgi:hypothetical protein
MALSFDECRAILDQFKRSNPGFLSRSEVHGVQVEFRHDQPTIAVLVTAEVMNALPDEMLPERFFYEFEGRRAELPVEARIVPMARAQAGVLCHPGDEASGDPRHFFGTLGWNFYLNGVLVCLSNWHVMCAQGNNTPIPSIVYLNGSPEAALYTFKPVYSTGNVWDYALAQYLSPPDASGDMRSCADGSQLPCPGILSPPASVHFGDNSHYYKVGARAPICRTGTLIGLSDVNVLYDDNVIRYFTSQLVFSKMTDSGDSGAVIVRQADTSATGLNFAGNDHFTYANPLYLVGWQRTGAIRFDGGVEIPMFSGSPTLEHAPLSKVPRTIEPEAAIKSLAAGLDTPPPAFTAGLYYLGFGVRVTDIYGNTSWEGLKEAPPIRSVQPISVLVSIDRQQVGYQVMRETFLHFG